MPFRIEQLNVLNLATVGNSITAGSFVKSGGTSSQFLKADGSVDSSVYITGITSGMVTTALGYTPVPTTRTLTINGTVYDLSADRSWTISVPVSSVSGSGAGISVSPTTGAVVVSNTGVTSNVAGTGISVSAATGAVTITNTGVTSIVAGTAISISGATGAVTINNAGVTSLNGGTGAITGIATTAQLAGYLPLSGGTITGTLAVNSDFSVNTTKFTVNAPTGNTVAAGSFTANSIIKSGGTSSQFLKADGSIDSNSYITSASVGNGTLTLAVSGSGLSGSASFTANQSGSTTFTVTSNATTSATANTIAYRDSGGDLYARYFFGSYVNTSDNDETGITRFVIKNGDNYHRSATTTTAMTVIRGVASGTWGIDVSGYATYLSTTNQGKTGAQGLVTVSSTTDWSNYPIGYSAMFSSGQTATGTPSSNYGFFIKVANRDAGGGWGGIWMDYSNGDMYQGTTTVSSSYATWRKLLDSSNYNSYSPTLTGGGASGTWSINITGNAGYASSAGNADTVDNFHASQSTVANNIVVRDANGYIFGNYINMTDDGNPGGGTAISSFITKQGDNYYRSVSPTNAMVSIRGVASGTWGISISGNAATASTSSQVTINYNNDSNSTYQMLWGSGNSVYGTAGVYVNPSTDYVYATSFVANGGWFRSTGASGWYNDTYAGGIYMTEGTTVKTYNNAAFAVLAGNQNGVYDASLYVEATNNNDWGVVVNKYNSSATEYGLEVRVGSGATYGFSLTGSGSRTFYVTGGGAVYGSIFYDIDNTGYYLNPGSSSNLYNVYVPNYFENVSGKTSGTHGYVSLFRSTQSAATNYVPFSFESTYGDHSWGIIARYRINTGGQDRPSIQFSYAGSDNRWNVGYNTGSDDNFRITQNMGYRNDNSTSDGWGTERFRIDTDGTTYVGMGGGTVYLKYGGSDKFWTGSDGTRNNGWLYFQTNGNGIHYPNMNSHFYMPGGNYWHINPTENSTYGALILYSNYNGTAGGATYRKGYLYYDTNGFGLLGGGDGAWAININTTTSKYVTIGGDQSNNAYNSVTGVRLMFGGGNSDAQGNYYIGTNLNNYGGNYNKLDLAWHTGIRIGAQTGYGGIRMYNDEDFTTLIFSVGEGDSNVRVTNNLYMGGNLVATQSWVNSQGFITGGSFLPYGNWSGNTGMNDYKLYLRTNGDNNHYLWNAGDDWEELNAYEGTGFRITSVGGSVGVLYVYGSSNGGYTYSPYSFRAPIFYDSDNTAYYGNFASTSVMNSITFGTSTTGATLSGNSDWGVRFSNSTGYIQLGPANGSYAHIYTDRGSFYFNVNNLYANGNLVLTAANYTNYTLPIGGGWYGVNMPGSRWGGYAVSGGEIVFGNGLPNAAQMGILIDGAYVAGENNGFWSLPSNNDWNGRRGMYWDGSYLNFTANSPTSLFTTLRLANGFELQQGGSNYGQFNSWVHLPGFHGLYSGQNSAHIYPNNGTYGSWMMSGSRNGWQGIEFNSGSNGNITLMVHTNSNESGFHNNSYGWQIYWSGGALYSGRNTYGGNTSRVLQEDAWISNKYFGSDGYIYGIRFYDANDSSYYLDPASTSELNSITTGTRARWGEPRWWTNRQAYTSDQNYWTGTNGWGTGEGTWATAWKGGFSGWDIWGSGTDHPQGSGYIHAQGIVSGQHAAASDGSWGYGWMMVGAADATANRYWLRGRWSTTTSSWVEMITTGNIGSQNVNYASQAGTASFAASAGNTSSISSATGGSYTWTGIQYFQSNLGGYCGSLSGPPLQAYSTGNNSAFMSFHKGGYYAVNMGLDADSVLRIGGWSAAANRWQLDMSGNMTVAGDVTAYSDARVKENIETVEDALDKVLNLRGVYYNRTDSDDKRRKVGVIAQEILEVIPEVVAQDNAGMYNVSYGNIVGVLIEAIKEQQKQIDELKSKLDGTPQ